MSWLLPDEPPLEADEIQGHLLVGFGGAQQALGAYAASDLRAAARTVGEWATDGRVTSAASLLPRKGRRARDVIDDVVPGPWVAIAVSHRLLAAAGAPRGFGDRLFRLERGMAEVATELNDPESSDGGPPGSDWVVGSPRFPVDVLVIAAAGSQAAAEAAVAQFTGDAERLGWCGRRFSEALVPLSGGREHFGFRDGLSQPAILGTIDGEPLESGRVPDDGDFPYAAPGQELTWPGEFMFGYPRRSRISPRRPGPVADAGRRAVNEFARNGSLLAYRRLAQDVQAFRAFCAQEAEAHGLEAEHFQALLVGRWQSGIPVTRDPAADPQDAQLVNGFDFSNDEMAWGCPLSAHIRKVNPRLGGSDFDNRVPRLLRRGAPYGPPFEEGQPEPAGGRGLAFIAYQTSLTDQFEALTRRWMASPIAPNNGGGHDPILGQPEIGSPRFLDLEQGRVEIGTQAWVRATGGAFLFAPSISALRSLASSA